MATKYKLRLKIISHPSPRKVLTIWREFVWDKKKDALDCQALLEKAKKSNNISLEFVEFTEEKILKGK